MKRYLKALWSKNAMACFVGSGIFCSAFYGFTGAVIGGLTGAALGAWCVMRRS
jgi:hypothetical protein